MHYTNQLHLVRLSLSTLKEHTRSYTVYTKLVVAKLTKLYAKNDVQRFTNWT